MCPLVHLSVKTGKVADRRNSTGSSLCRAGGLAIRAAGVRRRPSYASIRSDAGHVTAARNCGVRRSAMPDLQLRRLATTSTESWRKDSAKAPLLTRVRPRRGKPAERLALAGSEHVCEGGLEAFCCAACVFGAVEKAAVHVEREARRSVPELAADEDDIEALRDQQRREAVA